MDILIRALALLFIGIFILPVFGLLALGGWQFAGIYVSPLIIVFAVAGIFWKKKWHLMAMSLVFWSAVTELATFLSWVSSIKSGPRNGLGTIGFPVTFETADGIGVAVADYGHAMMNLGFWAIISIPVTLLLVLIFKYLLSKKLQHRITHDHKIAAIVIAAAVAFILALDSIGMFAFAGID